MTLTKPQIKALTILKDTHYFDQMTAAQFARKMWGDTETKMFTNVKNTGNGATSGKGAWLCAGSYLAKLINKGWVYKDVRHFYISDMGRKAIETA